MQSNTRANHSRVRLIASCSDKTVIKNVKRSTDLLFISFKGESFAITWMYMLQSAWKRHYTIIFKYTENELKISMVACGRINGNVEKMNYSLLCNNLKIIIIYIWVRNVKYEWRKYDV